MRGLDKRCHSIGAMLSRELTDVREWNVVSVNRKRMSALWSMSRYENWIVLMIVQHLKNGRLKPLTREDAIRKVELRTGVPDRRKYRTMIMGANEARSKSAR
jgi:hypothetical protein